MKYFKRGIMFLLMLSAITAIAAQPTNNVVFSSPNTPIKVQANQTEFTLTLQSNPSTGYSWFLTEYDNQLITSVSHQFIAPDSKLIGAPGYEIWTFKLTPTAFVVSQSTTVVMEYARPWDKSSGSKSAFKVYLEK